MIENPSAFFHTFTIAVSTEKRDILLDVSVEANSTERATVTFPDRDARLHLFCHPHELAGMVGAVLVGDAPPATATPEPTPLAVVTPSPTAVEAPAQPSDQVAVQRIAVMESIYPAYFLPDPITVKIGIPVELVISTEQSEHVNRISVLPWVESSDIVLPGRPVTIRFTPDQVGEFKIRNIGHGFEATLIVTE